MDEQDVRTRLHQELLGCEPALTIGVDSTASIGRGRLRRRRLSGAIAVGAAAVAVLTTTLLLAGTQGDGSPVASSTVDPATRAALDRYDADEMPELLEEKARADFGRWVTDLGSARFKLGDSTNASLPREELPRAEWMYVELGEEDQHAWRLYLGRDGASTEQVPSNICDGPLSSGDMLACEYERTDRGEVIMQSVSVAKVDPDKPHFVAAVDWRTLSDADLPNVRLIRKASVVHDGVFETSALEIVHGPPSLDPDEAFRVPAPALLDLASDPTIVIGPPQVG